MGDSSEIGGKLDDSSALEVTGKIMVVAIISAFFVVVSVFLIHLYAKWLRHRRPDSNDSPTTRRRRHRGFDFAAGYPEETAAAALCGGLDPSVLKTIPVVKFSPKDFKNGLECAVCLTQVSEGEKARLLPKCNHGFHVDCIDMWFQSHSTCPLCRNPVSKSTESRLETTLRAPPEESSASVETSNFPANVLCWGDETRVSTLGPCLQEPRQGPISLQLRCSSSSLAAGAKGITASTSSRPEGKLVIDIPREIVEDDGEQKSPMTTRVRSLKRLLSREKRVTPSSPSSNLDVEQGGRSQS